MTEEPYRWLEAISNRREYIRDQLKGGTPVFAVSRPEGILLLGLGQGQSKVFEIYDRHGLAAVGHPVDIEKLRQAAIEAAHLEGFNRSANDVTLRRLISFVLSNTLKTAFEQIFSPPIIVESIFAELGDDRDQDVLVRMNFDGRHHYATNGLSIAHVEPKREAEATEWLQRQLQPQDSLKRVAQLAVCAWKTLVDEKSFADLAVPPLGPIEVVTGRQLEVALLDRHKAPPVQYRTLQLT